MSLRHRLFLLVPPYYLKANIFIRKIVLDKEYIVDGKKLFYKVSPKREKVWKIELDILMELDRICRKHDLRYFLDSGTLLGAVRHKGFIPWDDDIDLTMPRKDYDRLIEIASQELKSPYYLQHITTDPKYPGIHVKIRNTDTTAIIKSWLFTDVNQGIFIDIFPLEGLPNDPEKADELYKKSSVLGRAVKSYYNFDKILSLNPKIILMLLKRRKLAKTLIKDPHDYVKKYSEFENLFKEIDFDSCKKVGPLSFYFSCESKVLFSKSCFDSTLYVSFEDKTLPIPCGYDEILKTYFGNDYMTPRMLPSLHGQTYYDPERSYTYYLPVLRKQYSLLSRLFRAIKSLYTHDSLTPLEKELYKL